MKDLDIRDAATLILVRDAPASPRILMGQRGAKAAFMPMKFVFPGGAVDTDDAQVSLADPLPDTWREKLVCHNTSVTPEAIAAAAIRELWEETGLILGKSGDWTAAPPEGWRSFAETGHLPAAGDLTFIFRAITPPGRPRRFDARFFFANADAIAGDLDDFTHASDELAHLQWVDLAKARSYDLPFITEVVLAELAARLKGRPGNGVPFFKNDTSRSEFLRL